MVKEDSGLAESNIPWWLTGGQSGAFKKINLKGSKCPNTLHCEPLGNQLCSTNHRDCVSHAHELPQPPLPTVFVPSDPSSKYQSHKVLRNQLHRTKTDPKTRFRGAQAYLGAQAARGKITQVQAWLLPCLHIDSSKMGTQPLSTISGTLDFHPGAEVVSHTT